MCKAGKGVIIDADIMHTTELKKLQQSCKNYNRAAKTTTELQKVKKRK